MSVLVQQDTGDDDVNHEKIKLTYTHANKVFENILAFRLPADPQSFAVWYTHVSKADQELSQHLEEIQETTGTVTVHDVRHLYDIYLIPKSKEAEKFNKLGDGFDHELRSVMNLVEDSIVDNATYAATLDKTTEMLPEEATPEQVRNVVATLVEQNTQVQQKAENLSLSLRESQSEISLLNGILDDAKSTSDQDSLTGLANRRMFEARLLAAHEDAVKNGCTVCVVMSMLDGFKHINNTHGIEIAEEILKLFGVILKDNLLEYGLAARYGATEFAILLPKVSMEAVGQMVRKVNKELEESLMVVKQTGREVGQITASFGISALRNGLEADALLERAKATLQDAKSNGGRNIRMDVGVI